MIQNKMILADNQYYDLDCYKTKLNNNVLVVGTSGSGKTRSIVSPNLLQATGSYVVSDPKGNLYHKYKNYLKGRGYRVLKVDFTHPELSAKYNPFAYIKDEQDIVKMAKMLADFGGNSTRDPFWDLATELLFTSIIGYIHEWCNKSDKNLTSIQKLISLCQVKEDQEERTVLDKMMTDLQEENPDSFAAKQYYKFRIAANRTLKSILITANSKLGVFDTWEMKEMLSEDQVHFERIGLEKTAVFVVVSDTDRSMDLLANLFFSQAMNELCRFADEKCVENDNRLPVDVRFILDDFATNVKINEFPRMIASIRSRGISTMLMIQAEGQLTNAYHDDDKTIIGNCDSYIYLGGNDVDTAQAVARRCDVPLKKILNMPVGTCWIFRRGQEPVHANTFELEEYASKMRELEARELDGHETCEDKSNKQRNDKNEEGR